MGTNATELGKTLKHLREMHRLEVVDAARVQALRSMARTLDEDPRNAALWREYRAALKELVVDDSSGSVDDALKALFADVGDTPPA